MEGSSNEVWHDAFFTTSHARTAWRSAALAKQPRQQLTCRSAPQQQAAASRWTRQSLPGRARQSLQGISIRIADRLKERLRGCPARAGTACPSAVPSAAQRAAAAVEVCMLQGGPRCLMYLHIIALDTPGVCGTRNERGHGKTSPVAALAAAGCVGAGWLACQCLAGEGI